MKDGRQETGETSSWPLPASRSLGLWEILAMETSSWPLATGQALSLACGLWDVLAIVLATVH